MSSVKYQAKIACVAHDTFVNIEFKKYKDQGEVIFDVKEILNRAVVDVRL